MVLISPANHFLWFQRTYIAQVTMVIMDKEDFSWTEVPPYRWLKTSRWHTQKIRGDKNAPARLQKLDGNDVIAK